MKITYRESKEGYLIPNLALPDDGLGEKIDLGCWGHMRRNFLKNHKRALYSQLLVSGKLRAHLHEIDLAANERWERLIKQMAQTEGVSEELKANDQMEWVGRMNNIRGRVEEIIREDLIYA